MLQLFNRKTPTTADGRPADHQPRAALIVDPRQDDVIVLNRHAVAQLHDLTNLSVRPGAVELLYDPAAHQIGLRAVRAARYDGGCEPDMHLIHSTALLSPSPHGWGNADQREQWPVFVRCRDFRAHYGLGLHHSLAAASLIWPTIGAPLLVTDPGGAQRVETVNDALIFNAPPAP